MREQLIRRVFFVPAKTTEAYRQAVDSLRGRMDAGEFPEFAVPGEARPLWSVVAQAPYNASGQPVPLAWEDQYAECGDRTVWEWKSLGGVRYALAVTGSLRELYAGAGGWNLDLPAAVPAQPAVVFEKMADILAAEHFPVDSIRRQWNYVEGITETTGGVQHYQALNDARSHFYAAASWEGGYPAATGIGTASGGFGVDLYAACGNPSAWRTWPIDNPLQVAAHRYSGAVLKAGAQAERTTPKFERARGVAISGRPVCCYVSGTAAIRAEQSLEGIGAAGQTRITLENIAALLEQMDPALPGAASLSALRSLRVYVKHPADIPAVAALVEAACPAARKVWLAADVCRPELLVEIEGVALFKSM